MRYYNRAKADELYFKFMKDNNGFDPLVKTNKYPAPAMRSVFYNLLMKYNEMNDADIEHWIEYKGYKKDRSSIYLAAKKIELYLFQSEEAKRSYKLYFDLEEEDDKRIDDELSILVDSIELKYRKEIYEMVKLKLKSYEWK